LGTSGLDDGPGLESLVERFQHLTESTLGGRDRRHLGLQRNSPPVESTESAPSLIQNCEVGFIDKESMPMAP
jgi:hypothetical protein